MPDDTGVATNHGQYLRVKPCNVPGRLLAAAARPSACAETRARRSGPRSPVPVPCPTSSLVRQYHVAHYGVDLGLPALAAEHTVVTGAGWHVVAPGVGLEALAQIVRRRGLPQGADVVPLALHRQQCGAPNSI